MSEKYKASVGVIAFDDDKVLLVDHTEKAKPPTGMHGLPAGRIEPGESLKQAGVRELFEETGLITTEENLILVPGNFFKRPIQLKNEIELLTYEALYCTKFEGVIRPSEDGKTIPHWFRTNNLPTLIFPDVAAAINNAIAFKVELEN